MKGRFRRTTGPDGTLATHRDKTIQTGHVQFGYGFRNGDGIHVLDGNICDLDEAGAFSRRTTSQTGDLLTIDVLLVGSYGRTRSRRSEVRVVADGICHHRRTKGKRGTKRNYREDFVSQTTKGWTRNPLPGISSTCSLSFPFTQRHKFPSIASIRADNLSRTER